MALEQLKLQRPRDAFITQQLALATYKGKIPDAPKSLEKARAILSELNPAISNDPETLGIWGAIHKRLWELSGKSGYDLSVYGPNGFFRSFKGSLTGPHKANLAVSTMYETDGGALALEIRNRGARTASVDVQDRYGHHKVSRSLQPGEGWTHAWSLDGSHNWYDLTVTVDSDQAFQQRIAGHVETGCDSMTDPAIGG